MKLTQITRVILPMGAALALSACGGAADEETTTYETDTVDQSGGELEVVQPDPDAVPVELPETEMTNVPAGEGTPAAAEPGGQ